MAKGTPRRNADLNNTSQPTSPAPQTPPSSRTKSATNLNSSPATRAAAAAPVETSYHKRLRSLLIDHKRLRAEWTQLVLRGLVGRVRATVEIWTDLETALAHVNKAATGATGKGATASSATNTVRLGYMAAQSARLSEQLAVVADVVGSLEVCLEGLRVVGERAEGLVVEGATTRGTAFAFKEPLWVTWPLARFADGLLALTAPYTSSLVLIRNLLDLLTTFPPLPPQFTLVTPSSKLPLRTHDNAGKVVARPTSEELQAAMSLLAVQPLIPGKAMEGGPEAWEELMMVEVPNWA